MTNVFCVANYILQKVGSTTTMKLQKLIYYCQAWSLAWDDKPLFNEDFEAWADGPVCPEIFKHHKGKFTLEADFFDDCQWSFDEEQKETMDAVIKYYGERSPHWLSELTHKERPWKDARKGYAPGDLCEEIITKESMLAYYGAMVGDE